MARPIDPKKREQDLKQLTSAGVIDGTPAQGQAFSNEKSDTGFVNAQRLLDANQGKGKTMIDNALSGQVDSTADWSDLDWLNKADPEAGLSSSTSYAEEVATETKDEKDAQGNTFKNTYTTKTVTPTTVTTYSGPTTSQVDERKAKVDGLRSRFEDLSTALGDSMDGMDLRQGMLADKVGKNIATYNAKQGGFDSFLMESEGQPSISSKRDLVKSMMPKFDGVNDLASSLKNRINTTSAKAGTTTGSATATTEKTASELIKPASIPVDDPIISTNKDGSATTASGTPVVAPPTASGGSQAPIDLSIGMGPGTNSKNEAIPGQIPTPMGFDPTIGMTPEQKAEYERQQKAKTSGGGSGTNKYGRNIN